MFLCFVCSRAATLALGFRFRIAGRQQQLRPGARNTRAGSSPVGHQQKRLFDKRFVARPNLT